MGLEELGLHGRPTELNGVVFCPPNKVKDLPVNLNKILSKGSLTDKEMETVVKYIVYITRFYLSNGGKEKVYEHNMPDSVLPQVECLRKILSDPSIESENKVLFDKIVLFYNRLAQRGISYEEKHNFVEEMKKYCEGHKNYKEASKVLALSSGETDLYNRVSNVLFKEKASTTNLLVLLMSEVYFSGKELTSFSKEHLHGKSLECAEIALYLLDCLGIQGVELRKFKKQGCNETEHVFVSIMYLNDNDNYLMRYRYCLLDVSIGPFPTVEDNFVQNCMRKNGYCFSNLIDLRLLMPIYVNILGIEGGSLSLATDKDKEYIVGSSTKKLLLFFQGCASRDFTNDLERFSINYFISLSILQKFSILLVTSHKEILSSYKKKVKEKTESYSIIGLINFVVQNLSDKNRATLKPSPLGKAVILTEFPSNIAFLTDGYKPIFAFHDDGRIKFYSTRTHCLDKNGKVVPRQLSQMLPSNIRGRSTAS